MLAHQTSYVFRNCVSIDTQDDFVHIPFPHDPLHGCRQCASHAVLDRQNATRLLPLTLAASA